MIALVWRFEVRAQHRDAFEKAYGAEGDWARLFARGEGYAGTELLRGEDGAYLTIDRWRSAEDFDAFIAAHRADYEALDRATEDWTGAERIGAFEACDRTASASAQSLFDCPQADDVAQRLHSLNF